jgi:hypothetical protein
MDIHKPKPVHSVREFLSEIGVIVCGILIALALEQVVVRLEWAEKVHVAEEAMRRELLWDDGPQVYQRVAMHDCLVGRLNDIRRAVERDAPRADIVRLVNGYQVAFLSYDTRARDDASHAGVTDHLTQAERDNWDDAYNQMPYMERTNADEATAIGHLRAVRGTGGSLGEAEQAHLLDAVETLRMLEYRMWRAGAFMLPAIRKLGTLDPKRMERFTTQAHKWYGAACYKDLPPGWTEPLSVDATEIR